MGISFDLPLKFLRNVIDITTIPKECPFEAFGEKVGHYIFGLDYLLNFLPWH